MHILLTLSVSTLAALPANFELHFKNRQAGNFRQAGSADIGLALGMKHLEVTLPVHATPHSTQDAADETIQFR